MLKRHDGFLQSPEFRKRVSGACGKVGSFFQPQFFMLSGNLKAEKAVGSSETNFARLGSALPVSLTEHCAAPIDSCLESVCPRNLVLLRGNSPPGLDRFFKV